MEFLLTSHHEIDGDRISFKGSFGFNELFSLNLTPLDRALLNDVGCDTEATSADHLLVLEMIFRRHHEHSNNLSGQKQNEVDDGN